MDKKDMIDSPKNKNKKRVKKNTKKHKKRIYNDSDNSDKNFATVQHVNPRIRATMW